jgi:hypothetical protein
MVWIGLSTDDPGHERTISTSRVES